MTIYLDWNAATPPDPRVLECVARAQRELWANPSSPHASGRAARAALEEAREQVAALCGVEPGGVTFCSSGTEALNLVATGLAPRGAHVLASAVEHRALLEPLEARAAGGSLAAPSKGEIELEVLRVDPEGRVSAELVADRIRRDTAFVAVLAAQNETGVLQPIDSLHAVTRGMGSLLVVDAAQAVGRVERDWARAGWDYLVLSAHKMRAPRGAAALVRRKHAPAPRPLLLGGGQELGRRAGTEDVGAIVGLGAACALVPERAARERELRARRDRFIAHIQRDIPMTVLAGAAAERLPQTVSVLVVGRRSEDLLAALDLEGVRASAGSACSSGALEPSHVLAAMGVELEAARGVLRFSFGETTTEGELDEVVRVLGRILK